jgi:hypothetical protein
MKMKMRLLHNLRVEVGEMVLVGIHKFVVVVEFEDEDEVYPPWGRWEGPLKACA